MSAYAIPAHNLRNLPAPISFEAAREEALRVHGPESETDEQVAAPLEAAAQAPQKTEAA